MGAKHVRRPTTHAQQPSWDTKALPRQEVMHLHPFSPIPGLIRASEHFLFFQFIIFSEKRKMRCIVQDTDLTF